MKNYLTNISTYLFTFFRLLKDRNSKFRYGILFSMEYKNDIIRGKMS
jgi:hypothetical protein